MAAITSPDYPGERLVVCRNPDLARERARKRQDLLAATEKDSPPSRPRSGAPASRCAARPRLRSGRRPRQKPVSATEFPATRENNREFCGFRRLRAQIDVRPARKFSDLQRNSLRNRTGNFSRHIRENFSSNRE